MVFNTANSFRLLLGLGCLFGLGSVSSRSMASDRDTKTYIMWHLTPIEGTTPELADKVGRSIRSYFEKRHKNVLLNSIKMDSTLLVEGNEKYLRCGIGSACLSGLAKAVGVNRVIAGEVGFVDGRISVKLVLVNVNSQKRISSGMVSYQGQPSAQQFEKLEVAMFEPGRYKGSLQVETQVGGAEVWLDGVKVGMTPLIGPLSDLSVGEHRLEVKKPGHEPFAAMVKIHMGKPVRVTAPLRQLEGVMSEKPFHKCWTFWTAAGIGVAGVVTAVFLHGDALELEDSAQACRSSGMTCYEEKQARADSRYLQSYLFYGIGGAGLIAAGVIAVVDLIYREPAEPWHGKNGLVFGVSPGPRSFNVSAIWRF